MHGSDLHIDTAGAGEPAIVLVHAGITDSRMWDPHITALAGSHRVVWYDVRGFGRSPDGEADYFDHDDLLGVMDACGLDRAVLVGASNGGRIVLDAAITAPDRVIGMVLVDAALPGMPSDPDLEAAFDAEEAALEAGDIATARDINLRLWVDGVDRDPGTVAPAARAAVTAWLEALLPRQASQLRGAGGEAQLVEPSLRDRLHEIAVPALVLVGRHDVDRFRATAHHLAANLPRAELAVIDDAAHLPSLERPEEFAALIRRFLASLPG